MAVEKTTPNGHAAASVGTSFDVIIIGAGVSGINAAYRLQSELPNYSYALLEARDNIGGTWDLFKYPGIRSDSDLFTFGFSFNPWDQNKPIAEGGSIAKYLKDTATKYGIDEHIQYGRRLKTANWLTESRTWSLDVEHEGTNISYTARFVIFSTGYYNYHQPLEAKIPGIENFKGQVIHPQFWPEGLDYSGKKVVIIGSGATAITLLPNIAEKAERVTMLQRSPTYILSVPNISKSWLAYILPTVISRKLQRISWIITTRLFYLFCQGFPRLSRWIFRQRIRRELPKHIPLDPHFQPRYNPWDQRVCICPDGDFFKSLRSGRADVKTDTIKTMTKNRIELNSGDSVDADIIVTATGLQLLFAGGAKVSVDGKEIDAPSKYLWNGVMVQDIPNASFVIGYTNASWTLGADATALFICRLLKLMESKGASAVVPKVQPGEKLEDRPLLNLKSTYLTSAPQKLPKAADKAPWLARDNYISDLMFAKYGKIDNSLEFLSGSSVKLQKAL
ncbi:hypothetical protein DTO164E3_3104 [Paecilomyces variotii]|nr:hypothetical protein DTO164E3_3104 [Paecilomyces variotii]KAJ9249448.1 hypothetical protein DTO207G8_6715 [Paecilomyces variotii]KAJ9315629.1 hypothetical protein DTO271D3_4202 [Paecilomyces variotii]KAJ9406847.1 hypothetical protein DTO045G8_5513 [Paecilomyces variotii]